MHLPGWEVIGIDSHVDLKVEAHLSGQDLSDLQANLANAEGRHVLVATHHPPIDVGCAWLDKDRIQMGQELLESLSEHPGVKAMVFGHVHQVVESNYRDIAVLGTPSTCFQFAPHTQTFSIDHTMPGYRWLRLSAHGVVRSEVRRVANYPLNIEID
jgi:Icc protein